MGPLGLKMVSAELAPLGALGRGASALVHRMLYLPEMRIVAVKSLSVFEEAARRQLKNELRVFLEATSDNIVGMLGGFFDEGYVTMVIEHMDRGDLQSYVDKHGPVSEPVAREVATQILKGLYPLHARHQVHRDIKPGNILLCSDGLVKLGDFGLARQLLDTNDYTLTPGGTIVYLSPERVTSNITSTAADIWAFGISLFHILTGHLPVPAEFWRLVQFMAAPEQEMPLKLDGSRFSAALCDFLGQSLRKDHTLRGTASSLLRHPWITGQPFEAFAPQSLMPAAAIAQAGSGASAVPIVAAAAAAASNVASEVKSGHRPAQPTGPPAELPWSGPRTPSASELSNFIAALRGHLWKGKTTWTQTDVAQMAYLAQQMGWAWEPFRQAVEVEAAMHLSGRLFGQPLQQAPQASSAAAATAAGAGAAAASASSPQQQTQQTQQQPTRLKQ